MVHVDNISSEKVALKNGMTFEKKLENFNIFRIDKKDWITNLEAHTTV